LNGVPLLSAEDRAFFADFKFEPLVIEDDGSHLTAAWNQPWLDLPRRNAPLCG
jgi:hypothetical protein